jgi:hypothetical protein
MRAFVLSKKFIGLLTASLFLLIGAHHELYAADKTADGKDGGKPVETTAAAKTDAPTSGLTERERWLLDRVEQLERRVAELESKGQPATTSASALVEPTAQPTSAAPTLGASVGTNPVAGSGTANPTTVANTNAVHDPISHVTAAVHSPDKKATKPPATEPFAFADFTWMNGNARTKEAAMDTKFFTPEIRADVGYIYDFNHPKDDTIGGSSEVFRSNEVQVTQLGVGGDVHFDNVRARLMTQFGLYSETTPRNDASPARGQWNLADAYRYISEAYGGYHINALHGINIDAGIFMSYIGLFSYYNFDNWAYQPSYVSSNTPWFFNGVRVQIFPTEHLKIEPWFINGWQSYGRFNGRPGLGMQLAWRPNGWFSLVSNNYGVGQDTLNTPGRTRIHTDDSIEVKYYDNKEKYFDKAAFSLTGDLGCEYGGGVSCLGNRAGGPKQSFIGFMLYNRVWFANDKYALTLGGGKINNPGRYLVLVPPINGATAASGIDPRYFTGNPGDPFKAWDASGTFDYMPSQYITFRWEFDHRAANVPYFSGSGGVTPPGGNTFGAPGSFVPGWAPDLRKTENRIDLSILVKF